LEQHQAEIVQAGLKVVAIALGEPKHARRYCGRLAPSITCLCNQAADVYMAYGLRRVGVRQVLQPGLWAATARATLRGNVQGQATGDTTMLPGTFVVDRQGIIRYAYYSTHAGDHPDLTQLIEDLESGEFYNH
jgi:peroxiredoxin